LSVALSAIRKVVEPPGVPLGATLVADRFTARLDARSVGTDVRDFESLLSASARVNLADEEAALLERAIATYTRPLLAGYSEDWIPPEEERLADRFFDAAWRLAAIAEEAGDLPRAVSAARRAVSIDPLREDAVRTLMRLYAAAGQPAAALRHYHRLQQRLS